MKNNNAIVYCASKESYLVQIKTDTEFSFIQNYLKNQSIQYSVWVNYSFS
jgi:hypothetical protein